MFDRIQSFDLSPTGYIDAFSCETFTDALGDTVKGPLRLHRINATDAPQLFADLAALVYASEIASLQKLIADKVQATALEIK